MIVGICSKYLKNDQPKWNCQEKEESDSENFDKFSVRSLQLF